MFEAADKIQVPDIQKIKAAPALKPGEGERS